MENDTRLSDGWCNYDIHRRNNTDGFTFGDIRSLDYGIYLTDISISGTPERDISFVSVAGRNGDLLIDNKRWKNIDITYHCAIATNFAERFDRFRNDLLQQTGYQRLTDTIYPDVFRMGVVKQPINPETMRRNRTGTFDIVFNCKPQRFLFIDQYTTTLTADKVNAETGAAYYWNTSGQPARPLITVYGTGPGKLTVGNVTIDILALKDHITIDCDLMTAYRQEGDAAVENKNADIYALDFPELSVGENAISWTGGITQVDIVPRGWML
jgi:phage-related protein